MKNIFSVLGIFIAAGICLYGRHDRGPLQLPQDEKGSLHDSVSDFLDISAVKPPQSFDQACAGKKGTSNGSACQCKATGIWFNPYSDSCDQSSGAAQSVAQAASPANAASKEQGASAFNVTSLQDLTKAVYSFRYYRQDDNTKVLDVSYSLYGRRPVKSIKLMLKNRQYGRQVEYYDCQPAGSGSAGCANEKSSDEDCLASNMIQGIFDTSEHGLGYEITRKLVQEPAPAGTGLALFLANSSVAKKQTTPGPNPVFDGSKPTSGALAAAWCAAP